MTEPVFSPSRKGLGLASPDELGGVHQDGGDADGHQQGRGVRGVAQQAEAEELDDHPQRPRRQDGQDEGPDEVATDQGDYRVGHEGPGHEYLAMGEGD